MYDEIVSERSFMLKCCPDRYKTQEMCNKVVDHFPPALKFVPDWFIMSKMIKRFHGALFTNDKILLFDEDSVNFTFSSDEIRS